MPNTSVPVMESGVGIIEWFVNNAGTGIALIVFAIFITALVVGFYFKQKTKISNDITSGDSKLNNLITAVEGKANTTMDALLKHEETDVKFHTEIRDSINDLSDKMDTNKDEIYGKIDKQTESFKSSINEVKKDLKSTRKEIFDEIKGLRSDNEGDRKDIHNRVNEIDEELHVLKGRTIERSGKDS